MGTGRENTLLNLPLRKTGRLLAPGGSASLQEGRLWGRLRSSKWHLHQRGQEDNALTRGSVPGLREMVRCLPFAAAASLTRLPACDESSDFIV